MTSRDVELKIKQRVNKKDTQDYDDIPVYQIVEAYNKAELQLVSRIYGQNNLYKQGFEATRKRVDDLRVLIPETPKKLLVTKYKGYYLTDELPEDYFHYIRSTTDASTSQCKNKSLRNWQVEESNINSYLNNSDTDPSFEWGETIVTLVGNKLKIYTNDKFDVNSVRLTYLKRPKGIDIEGYIKQDGSPSTNIDPEFPDEVVEMCIDEACRIITGDIQDPFGNQTAQQNLQLSE